MGLAALVYGAVIFVEGFSFGFESKDEAIQRYIVKGEQLPSGLERDIWMVGTFRKAAIILENRFAMYKLAVLDMVSGLLMAATGLLAIVLAVITWAKALQQWLLAKLLRCKWEEEIGKN